MTTENAAKPCGTRVTASDKRSDKLSSPTINWTIIRRRLVECPCGQTTKRMGRDVKLPASAQEIADVIGRERALFLIGQLPRCYSRKSCHVILYVPKVLRADHPLVSLLGWHDAARLADHFGGEILQPASCHDVYRRFRDAEARRMLGLGMSARAVADVLGVSDRHIRNLAREKPQEDQAAANDNTAAVSNRRAG